MTRVKGSISCKESGGQPARAGSGPGERLRRPSRASQGRLEDGELLSATQRLAQPDCLTSAVR